jgi:hypothetical protein
VVVALGDSRSVLIPKPAVPSCVGANFERRYRSGISYTLFGSGHGCDSFVPACGGKASDRRLRPRHETNLAEALHA